MPTTAEKAASAPPPRFRFPARPYYNIRYATRVPYIIVCKKAPRGGTGEGGRESGKGTRRPRPEWRTFFKQVMLTDKRRQVEILAAAGPCRRQAGAKAMVQRVCQHLKLLQCGQFIVYRRPAVPTGDLKSRFRLRILQVPHERVISG